MAASAKNELFDEMVEMMRECGEGMRTVDDGSRWFPLGLRSKLNTDELERVDRFNIKRLSNLFDIEYNGFDTITPTFNLQLHNRHFVAKGFVGRMSANIDTRHVDKSLF